MKLISNSVPRDPSINIFYSSLCKITFIIDSDRYQTLIIVCLELIYLEELRLENDIVKKESYEEQLKSNTKTQIGESIIINYIK